MDTGRQDELERRLRDAESAKEGGYDKRTEHLEESGRAVFINRLILEDSPYLLQHAHNPVNWYPWGEEAFASARDERKPVFLSIGYSTCHWCHVMEVESFDNVEVAKVLNRHFISVKMDREQYPDIDEVYMTGVQCMTGHGGWPMSNFLLPDGRPFFGATYFPPGQFIALLRQVYDVFGNRFDELERSAASLHESIQRILAGRRAPSPLPRDLPASTLQALYQREDEVLGGLAGAPKFPQEPFLLLALDHAARNRDRRAFQFAERCLRHMAMGGIYDHVGGGFHRYSIDARWLVPHFEKMLYNQSQLAMACLQAWQLGGGAFFRRTLEQTLDYVLRELQLPEGGFCSATDADSEGREGAFFVWSMTELEELFDEDELALLIKHYGVSGDGNFEGDNILHLSAPFPEGEAGAALDAILLCLRRLRSKREPPLRDDKLIAGWTGAMIAALCQAAWALDRPDWLDAAERAAKHLWQANYSAKSGLRRIWLQGSVSIDGQLEDYANFALALLQLSDVTGKAEYLRQAAILMREALARFLDPQTSGFHLASEATPGPQLVRSRNASDGAQISPVATALECLIGLHRRNALLPDEDAGEFSAERISACIAELAAAINENPVGHPSLLRAINAWESGACGPVLSVGQGRAIVLARRSESEQGRALELRLRIAQGWYITAPGQTEGAFEPLSISLAESESNWRLGEMRCGGERGSLTTPDGKEVEILQGEVQARIALAPAGEASSQTRRTDEFAASAAVRLQVQLCYENSCQLPETLGFRL